MKNRLFAVATAVLAMLCVVCMAQASTINPDQVYFAFGESGWGSGWSYSGDGMVSETGTNVEFSIKYHSAYYLTVDVDIDTICFKYVYKDPCTKLTGSNVKIWDIDFTDSSTIIGYSELIADRAVTVTTGANWASFDLGGTGGLTWGQNDEYKIRLITDAVPIPGAVWLLGSGLLGIVGIRRKLKK